MVYSISTGITVYLSEGQLQSIVLGVPLPCSHPQLSQLQTSDVSEIINQLELSLFILTNISQIDDERRCEANHLPTEGLGVPTSAYLQMLFWEYHGAITLSPNPK